MTDVRNGSCLCGAVQFITRGPVRGVIYCHCSQCRKQTGHYFAATNVKDAEMDARGTDNVTWFAASNFARRGFCRTCGSVLFWKRNGSDTTSVLAGSFDTPTGLKGEEHLFVADKGDYYEIEDGLPQFGRSSPSIEVAED
ncbi:GFA family protein [Mesorhizobium sp. SP-1A]|uniref:GFA family protein n=1 Tax=Mesorhizobium sp. SP-1A TaxID=3077840 RepID=UPI0028F6F904|nr:GFA family protein [Mesorhizobium sp. SP-1A]